jgi:glycosyltransferase involved in cell wall biosynthesis
MPEELVDLIVKLISDSGFRQSHIKLGLNRSAEFTWERTALETLDAYKEAYDA